MMGTSWHLSVLKQENRRGRTHKQRFVVLKTGSSVARRKTVEGNLHLFVLKYSLESHRVKVATAESKPHISDNICMEGKALSLSSVL